MFYPVAFSEASRSMCKAMAIFCAHLPGWESMRLGPWHPLRSENGLAAEDTGPKGVSGEAALGNREFRDSESILWSWGDWKKRDRKTVNQTEIQIEVEKENWIHLGIHVLKALVWRGPEKYGVNLGISFLCLKLFLCPHLSFFSSFVSHTEVFHHICTHPSLFPCLCLTPLPFRLSPAARLPNHMTSRISYLISFSNTHLPAQG